MTQRTSYRHMPLSYVTKADARLAKRHAAQAHKRNVQRYGVMRATAMRYPSATVAAKLAGVAVAFGAFQSAAVWVFQNLP